jgi:hypothetical protein
LTAKPVAVWAVQKKMMALGVNPTPVMDLLGPPVGAVKEPTLVKT